MRTDDESPRDDEDPFESLGFSGEHLDRALRAGLSDDDAADTPAPDSSPCEDNDLVGKYRIDSVIGRGGVGSVFRGRDIDLGRDVALKFLHDRFADDPALVRRFVEEAQIGGQLQHPGIVPVYDLGLRAGRPFFSMKLVNGKTLAQRLADRTRPEDDLRRFLSIFESVCQTVAYAHTRGVVHRDLKPSNIMVGAFGEVMVLDWGLGKILAEDEPESIPGAARRIGTPAYMSPEQDRGELDAVDERSDVYSLGAVLFEILTGAPPSATDAEIEDALALRPIDPMLRQLCRRSLALRPEDRPANGSALAEAIAGYLALAERRVIDAEVRASAARRTQRLFATVVVSVIAALGVSLYFWYGADRARADETAARGREAEARLRAEGHLANYDNVSVVPLLERAQRTRARLYPAWPEHADAMRRWLDADAAAVLDRIPALREAIKDLRSKAETEPFTNTSVPRGHELNRVHAEIRWWKYRDAVRRGKAKVPARRVDWARFPENPVRLSIVGRQLVDPKRRKFGREPLGLILTRQAAMHADSSSPRHRAEILINLAWACLANGIDKDAEEAAQAVGSLSALGHVGPRYAGEAVEIRERIAKPADAAASIERLEAHARELEQQLDQRRRYRFADPAHRFLHDTLVRALADVERFAKEDVASVRHDLRWSECVEALTLQRFAQRWSDAIAAVRRADGTTASETYGKQGVHLRPILGLVPIGMNPKTKLWEFYHLRSAWDPRGATPPEELTIPEHEPDGSITLRAETGIVFVLLPGKRARRGRQAKPHLFARFELTRGQWIRLGRGRDPSTHAIGRRTIDGPVTTLHPVDNVSFNEARGLLDRHGCKLPSAAAWEQVRAAGALAGNLKGDEDGFAETAPVGQFAPNAFGIHDVHGNVREWARAGPQMPKSQRPGFGGGFRSRPADIRSAGFAMYDPESRAQDLGVRVARMLPTRRTR